MFEMVTNRVRRVMMFSHSARRVMMFTDRARHVMDLAELEARRLDHSYIGTEHLLLGLIRDEEGVAAKALESLGVSLEAARQKVEELLLGDGQPLRPAPPRHADSGEA